MRRIQEKYADYITDLKRQLANLRPYHGVMAERQIRRLTTQVKDERSKRLKGRPKKWSPDDIDSDHEEDIQNVTALSRSSFGGTHSLSQTRRSSSQDASFRSGYAVSTNLHSSKSPASRQSKMTPGDFLETALLSNTRDHHQSSDSRAIPSLEYLKGALWLGRNLVMHIEELSGKVEKFRTQYLREVTLTADDSDIRRACQRLTLLAASRVGEIVTAVEDDKMKIRQLIHVSMF